ncbi:PRC-barrel domain containing protein [Shumkonia mesophila]|uniref:PRC-barrel domain containing protein n=1 Tax=Shumkonia mesophila TaxID=2838854 RepID=UPI0029340E78|nr:PRC-barrel domain-containing protein [Shumkonia mesophila]
MLRSLDGLIGYGIQATDGPIGTVKDFLFDDQAWVVRYMVADTGKWLPGGKVLVVPSALEHPEWDRRSLPVKLTRRQVEEGPDIGEDQPVSHQHEIDLHHHFEWDPYWLAYAAAEAATPFPPAVAPESPQMRPTRGDPRLRSGREVEGYHVKATDGEIGHVEDFILDDEGWVVRYVVVDTRNWLPGKKVLVSPEWFDAVNWTDQRVVVDISREGVRNSPPYDPSRPVNREDEGVLYDYHGRPAYWKDVLERTGATVGHW